MPKYKLTRFCDHPEARFVMKREIEFPFYLQIGWNLHEITDLPLTLTVKAVIVSPKSDKIDCLLEAGSVKQGIDADRYKIWLEEHFGSAWELSEVALTEDRLQKKQDNLAAQIALSGPLKEDVI